MRNENYILLGFKVLILSSCFESQWSDFCLFILSFSIKKGTQYKKKCNTTYGRQCIYGSKSQLQTLPAKLMTTANILYFKYAHKYFIRLMNHPFVWQRTFIKLKV